MSAGIGNCPAARTEFGNTVLNPDGPPIGSVKPKATTWRKGDRVRYAPRPTLCGEIAEIEPRRARVLWDGFSEPRDCDYEFLARETVDVERDQPHRVHVAREPRAVRSGPGRPRTREPKPVRVKRDAPTKQCLHCGDTFTKSSSTSISNFERRMFCGKTCMGLAHAAAAAAKPDTAEHWEKNCEMCGTVMKRRRFKSSGKLETRTSFSERRYCSTTCQGRGARKEFTPEQIADIVRRHGGGESYERIANDYECSKTHVCRIYLEHIAQAQGAAA